MGQNVGPTTAGDQESGWLYSQTNSLRHLGAKLTYSGDSPFLLRLVIGVSNEQSSDTVSWLQLYVSNDTTVFRPLTCEPETGKELNSICHFEKSYRRRHWSASKTFNAFVQMPPKIITRCVETDLRKKAQK